MNRTSPVFSVVASAMQQGSCGFAPRRVALGWLLSAAAHTLLVVVLAVMTLDSGDSSPSFSVPSGKITAWEFIRKPFGSRATGSLG